MSSGLRLALLTLNLPKYDFNRMDRDNLKKYIENFFKQEHIQKDFERYKLAAKLVLENKSKPIVEEEENIYNNVVNVEEENSYRRSNNKLINPFFHPFSMFNNSFSNMINEIDNLHSNFGNLSMQNNSTNMMNVSNSNGFTKSYSRTYVNNNGTGYMKEESIENDGKGTPKVKSFYRKIENGKYVEEPVRSSKKLIEQ
jgi:hypothetical protein